MRRLLIVLAILTGYAHAGNWYVHVGATGTNAGTSWTNAWPNMSSINLSSVSCGDTIWLAGGTYSAGISMNKVCTSGNVLSFRRVLSTDAVPVASPGWNSSFDSQVIILNDNVGNEGDFNTLDGRVGNSKTGLAYGISIQCTTGASVSCDGVEGASTRNITNNTFTYVEIVGPPCVHAGTCTGVADGFNQAPTTFTITNLLIDHCYIHTWAETVRAALWHGATIQYSDISDTAQTVAEHEDTLFSYDQVNLTIRYNRIYTSPNDGMFFNGNETNTQIYGNTFYHSGGAVITWFTGLTHNVFVYNNVFENDGTFGDFQPGWLYFQGTVTGEIANNAFWQIDKNGTCSVCNHNAYDISGQSSGETGSFTYSQNSQFVNLSTGAPAAADFHLTSTGKTTFVGGKTLSVPFNMDADGNTRGATGVWYIGAFDVPATNTWNILLTGGNPTQCTGLVNAAYPGSGSGQPCAFNHPFWLVRSDGTTMVQPGDTVQFDDLGPYLMGQQMDGLGFDWSSLQPALNCVGGNVENRDCHMPNDSSIFNGTDNTHKTRFLGKNAGACTIGNSTTTGNETVLTGINHINWVWSFDNGQFQDMECIAMTGHDKCQQVGIGPKTITNTAASGGIATYTFTDPGDPHLAVDESVTVTGTTNGSGVFNITGNIITLTGTTFTLALTGTVASHSDTGTAVFANGCQNGPGHVGLENWASNGILFGLNTDQGPSNVVLNDLHLYGIVNSAILGSHFNRTSGDVMTITNLNMDGDGQEGFNADDGNGGTANEAVGTMNFSNWDVEWIGFLEISPGVFNFGVDQGFLGNGDCIVMVASGGTWNWSNINIRFCAQDGFDGLHLRDDLTVNPIVNINQMQSRQIEGQTIKIGAKTAVITNSIANSDSNWPFDDSFPSNPLGWNSLIGLTFRANDGITAAIGDGSDITFQNVTNITNQNVWWDFSPGVSGNCTTSTSCRMSFQNNASFGYTNPSSPIFIGTTFDPLGNPASLATNNSWWHIGGGGVCPGNSHESAQVCTNPQFTQQVTMYSPDFNPLPLSSSPLKAAGVHLTGVPTDFNGATRANPPTIGAIEAAGGSVTLTSITVLPNPGSVVTSSTVNFQTSSFCTFSDSSTVAAGSTGCVVVWSTTGAHSTINSSTGVATGVSAGSDTIAATLSPATPATATLNVTAPASGSTIIMGIQMIGVQFNAH